MAYFVKDHFFVKHANQQYHMEDNFGLIWKNI